MNYKTFRLIIISTVILFILMSISLCILLFTNIAKNNIPAGLQTHLERLVLMQKNERIMMENDRQIMQLLNLDSPDFIDPEGEEEVLGIEEQGVVELANDRAKIAFFDALSFMDGKIKADESIAQLNRILSHNGLESLKQKYKLELAQLKPQNFVLEKDDIPWLNLSILNNTRAEATAKMYNLELRTALDQEGLSIDINTADKLREDDIAYIAEQFANIDRFYKNFLTMRSELASFLNKKIIQDILREKRASIRKQDTAWEIYNADLELISSIDLKKENFYIGFEEYEYTEQKPLEAAIIKFLQNIEARDSGELLEERARAYLDEIFKDPGFITQMAKYNLYISPTEPREDEYYTYYDLQNEDEEHVASFALQKGIGEIYLMDQDDVRVKALKSFSEGDLFADEDSKEQLKLSTQAGSKKGSQVALKNQASGSAVLIVGTHAKMADVIMLAYIDDETKTNTLISLPRDLYYRGYKINSIYSRYGITEFMNAIAKITNLNISKYIAIDMYAFVEVVDLLDGIDIELREALIDPTYKIKEMGQWKTLFLKKGKHHLNGLGALRLARSRNTSDDFERSKRQQKIIVSLATKLDSVNFANVNQLLGFIKIFYKYIDSNISISELARTWLRVGDYKRLSGNTLDTSNILYSTYTNLRGMDEEKQQELLEDKEFFKGAFILLPIAEDWSLIPNFIGNILSP